MTPPPQNRCVGVLQRQDVVINHRTGMAGLDFRQASSYVLGSRHANSVLSSGLSPALLPWEPSAIMSLCGYQVPLHSEQRGTFIGTAGSQPSCSHSQESATLSGAWAAAGRVWLGVHPIPPFVRCGMESDSLCDVSTAVPKSGLSLGLLFCAVPR